MDINAILKKLLSNESVTGVAKKVGVDVDDVKKVFASALPMLLGGANNQSKNKETAQSFADALSEHAKKDTKDITSFLKDIDIQDGAKIIGHLFGGNPLKQAESISKKSGVTKANTGNILSMMGPLFMSLLGQEAQTQQTTAAHTGSLMDSLFGSMMGGNVTQQQSNDMGNLFSAMLGGNNYQQQVSQVNPFEALFGGSAYQQQTQQANPFEALFGGNSYQQQTTMVNPFEMLFGANSNPWAQQQQTQVNPLEALLGGAAQQQQQQQSPFEALLGNAVNQSNNTANGDNVTGLFNQGNQNQSGMGGLDILSQLFGGR